MNIRQHMLFAALFVVAILLPCNTYADPETGDGVGENQIVTPPRCALNSIAVRTFAQPETITDKYFVSAENFFDPSESDKVPHAYPQTIVRFSNQHAPNSPASEEDLPTKTVLAFKSNLLYDVVSLVNYSIEIPIVDQFSVLCYHQFPWWRWGKAKNEFCLRFLSVGGEMRWWVGLRPQAKTEKRIRRDRLVGHYIGLYAESGRFDFERKRDICYQGEFWSAGLSYGYSMPIGRRLNLEFSISAGYASIPYRGYTPSEDYEILWRDPKKIGRWDYFGLTKAQVSLVIPITGKIKSGGAR